MSTRTRHAFLALALALGLTVGGAVAFRNTRPPAAGAGPDQPAVVSASALASPPSPVGPPVPSAPGPPAPAPSGPPRASVHVPSRYLTANHARRATWDDVLAAGRVIPRADRRCARAWRTSGKDRRIDWRAARYQCLTHLPGLTFKPQGVAGSGTTEDYRISGRPAHERHLVLTSWYSRSAEQGLIAPNRPGESVTRLVVMDLERGRYNTVELVRTDGRHRFRNLDSHGSGLAWAGQYLYSSSRSSLWMYNADDLLRIRGRFVLPAVAAWSVEGQGGLSSISIDRTTTPGQLTAVEYSKDARAHIQNFDLAPGGLLAATSAPRRSGLALHTRFGYGERVVHSADSEVVDGSSFQGVATLGDYALVNSSALRLDGPDRKPVDATVVLKRGEVVRRFQMPIGNVESIYLDHRRGTYTTVTENRSRFLFTLPLPALGVR